ncbi:MAG: response regulator [Gemmatimonadota bacterium]|jgi:DNA-binding NtrC family response regulator
MALMLVVDDEVRIREVLELILSELGHDVLTCVDGKAAVAAVDQAPVDLVITDVIMPNMDGIEVLLSLKESHPGLPVVVMSGGGPYDTRILLKTAGLLGAVVTLEKPFGPQEVTQAIEQALGAPRDAR